MANEIVVKTPPPQHIINSDTNHPLEERRIKPRNPFLGEDDDAIGGSAGAGVLHEIDYNSDDGGATSSASFMSLITDAPSSIVPHHAMISKPKSKSKTASDAAAVVQPMNPFLIDTTVTTTDYPLGNNVQIHAVNSSQQTLSFESEAEQLFGISSTNRTGEDVCAGDGAQNDVAVTLGHTLDSFARAIEDLNQEFERSIEIREEKEDPDVLYSTWTQIEKRGGNNSSNCDLYQEDDGGDDNDDTYQTEKDKTKKKKKKTSNKRADTRTSNSSSATASKQQLKKLERDINDLNEDFDRAVRMEGEKNEAASCWNEIEKHRDNAQEEEDSTNNGGKKKKKTTKPASAIYSRNVKQTDDDDNIESLQNSSSKISKKKMVEISKNKKPTLSTSGSKDGDVVEVSRPSTPKKKGTNRGNKVRDDGDWKKNVNSPKKTRSSGEGGGSGEGEGGGGRKRSSGLSELSKQLRVLQAKNESQSVDIDRLEKQLKLMSDLQGVSVQDLRSALDRACEQEAHAELTLQIKQLKAQLDGATALHGKRSGAGDASATVGGADIEQQHHYNQIANLELRIGELEEIEQAKQEEIDRLYKLLDNERNDDSTANIWKKRYEACENQNKLKLQQQQARLWVQEERIRDMEQQLSSLYTAFGVLQQDHETEQARRSLLESSLQDADAQVAKQIAQVAKNQYSRPTAKQNGSMETNQFGGASATPTAPPNRPVPVTPSVAVASPSLQLAYSPAVAPQTYYPNGTPISPAAHSTASYDAGYSSPRQYQQRAPAAPQPFAMSLASIPPESSPVPPRSCSSNSSTGHQSSFRNSSASYRYCANGLHDDDDRSPLARGKLLIESGGGLLPRRWHEKVAALYPASKNQQDGGALLVIDMTHQYYLRPATTRIGRYMKHKYGMVLYLPNRHKTSLHIAARSESEYQRWATVFAACLGPSADSLLQNGIEDDMSDHNINSNSSNHGGGAGERNDNVGNSSRRNRIELELPSSSHGQHIDDDEDIALLRAIEASKRDM